MTLLQPDTMNRRPGAVPGTVPGTVCALPAQRLGPFAAAPSYHRVQKHCNMWVGIATAVPTTVPTAVPTTVPTTVPTL